MIVPVAQELLSSRLTEDPTMPKNWGYYAALRGHIVAVCAHYVNSGREFPGEFRGLILRLLRYLYVTGQYESSRDLARLVEPSWESLGELDDDWLSLRKRLATALQELGYSEANQDLLLEALAVLESVWQSLVRSKGSDASEALQAANNVVVTLHRLGEYQRAYGLSVENVELAKASLGEAHPETLRLADNVGVCAMALHEFEVAELRLRQTLHQRELVLGPAHQDTLWTACNLAETLSLKGERKSSEAVLQVTLSRSIDELGDTHPVSIRARHLLLELEARQG